MAQGSPTEPQPRDTEKLEALGVLAGGVAHAFNNLLTVILGNASLIESDLPPESPHRALIEQVIGASWRAADLCKQMLAYSGRGQFAIERLDLNGLIRNLPGLPPPSTSQLIQFHCHLAEPMPAIEADAGQIRQVVLNLVTNAVEAIGAQTGEVRLATGVRPVNQPQAAHVYLEVIDTGCGMDQATREKVFDPFFTTKFLGRGLGLAAVLGIVRGHGGFIEVESQPGRGSTFRVLLPAPPALP